MESFKIKERTEFDHMPMVIKLVSEAKNEGEQRREEEWWQQPYDWSEEGICRYREELAAAERGNRGITVEEGWEKLKAKIDKARQRAWKKRGKQREARMNWWTEEYSVGRRKLWRKLRERRT